MEPTNNNHDGPGENGTVVGQVKFSSVLSRILHRNTAGVVDGSPPERTRVLPFLSLYLDLIGNGKYRRSSSDTAGAFHSSIKHPVNNNNNLKADQIRSRCPFFRRKRFVLSTSFFELRNGANFLASFSYRLSLNLTRIGFVFSNIHY